MGLQGFELLMLFILTKIITVPYRLVRETEETEEAYLLKWCRKAKLRKE